MLERLYGFGSLSEDCGCVGDGEIRDDAKHQDVALIGGQQAQEGVYSFVREAGKDFGFDVAPGRVGRPREGRFCDSSLEASRVVDGGVMRDGEYPCTETLCIAFEGADRVERAKEYVVGDAVGIA